MDGYLSSLPLEGWPESSESRSAEGEEVKIFTEAQIKTKVFISDLIYSVVLVLKFSLWSRS